VRETSLTDKGAAAFAEIWPMMYGRFRTMFDGIGEDEYQAFTATLHRIIENMRRSED
jgi:DNA-binding MarR family transcriptional regulator